MTILAEALQLSQPELDRTYKMQICDDIRLLVFTS